ncbi:MAG TPA: hypothetical protein VGI83_00790, partial [Gemmatimonadales bacterium]
MTDQPTTAVNVSDDELLHRVSQGSESALSTLYDRYAPLLCAVARALGADQDQVVLDAFAAVAARADEPVAGRGSLRSWLVAEARRHALNDGGRKAPGVPSSAGPMEAALRQLGVSEREAVQLAVAGLSEDDIAERLEEALPVVRARLRAGMGKLRETL